MNPVDPNFDQDHTYYYTYKPERRKLTLLVDKNLIELARDMGINLSRFLEEKLREELNHKNNACGGRDLNPRTPSGQDLKSCAFDLSRQPPLFLITFYLSQGGIVDTPFLMKRVSFHSATPA